MSDFLRNVFIPLFTFSTTIALIYFTYKLLSIDETGAGAITGLLTLALGYFVYHDAQRLLAKAG